MTTDALLAKVAGVAAAARAVVVVVVVVMVVLVVVVMVIAAIQAGIVLVVRVGLEAVELRLDRHHMLAAVPAVAAAAVIAGHVATWGRSGVQLVGLGQVGDDGGHERDKGDEQLHAVGQWAGKARRPALILAQTPCLRIKIELAGLPGVTAILGGAAGREID